MNKRIALSMVAGDGYGWGTCATKLAEALGKTHEVRIISRQKSSNNEHWSLAESTLLNSGHVLVTKDPVIHAVAGPSHLPIDMMVRSETLNIGYTFFEDRGLAEFNAPIIPHLYDHMATGSTWNTDVLRKAMSANGYRCRSVPVTTVLQGVDQNEFSPMRMNRDELFLFKKKMLCHHLQGKFCVFSGGKFEYRKGQDIVIQAMTWLKDLDLHLVACWDNPWPETSQSMSKSKHIKFSYSPQQTLHHQIQMSFESLGVPRDSYTLLGLCSKEYLKQIYNICDIGVFPNRCEGGTNLVMMEFMACGNPVIATPKTGHWDIFRNPGRLPASRALETYSDGDSDVDPKRLASMIRAAYNEWKVTKCMLPFDGANNADLMKNFTWERTAASFIDIIEAHQAKK